MIKFLVKNKIHHIFKGKKESWFFISREQIEADIQKGAKLVAEKRIVEKVLPDTWTLGVNWKLNYWSHLFLAIFLGFIGLDRFYLGKKISATAKAFIITVLFPLMVLAIIYLDFVKTDYITSVIFLTMFFGGVGCFYFGDIILAIKCPRDIECRRLVRRNYDKKFSECE